MDYDTFVREVAQHAGVPRDQASVLTRATLQTLAERLTGGEADDVAAQLPMQMKEWLLSHATPAAEKFGVDEFVRRVSDKANATPEEARRGARAVFVTLRAAVTAGEFKDVMSQLPKEFSDLAEGSQAG
jgi:uncharacterized protein (DUF2267 family)